MIANRRAQLAPTLTIGLAVLLGACGGSAPAPLATPAVSVGTTAGASASTPAASPAQTPTEAPLPGDIPRATLDVTVAADGGSGEITPERGGTITATTADGATWTLVVGPWAVRTPVTVELRPLSGSSTLGRVVAGVDLSPAGLRLAEPATLTVRGPVVPPTVVALEYHGEAATADSRLVIGPGTAGGSMVFSVAHFSGNVAVDVGTDANGLYERWSAVRGDDSPQGRQAAAETRYAAADLAERNGRISGETASGIKDRAMTDWLEAESDRLTGDPALTKLAESGDPKDLDVVGAEISKILQVEHQLAVLGDESRGDGLAKVVETLAAYEAAIVNKVMDSQRIKDAASSGRVSDTGEILDLIGVVLSLQRQIELLGGEGSDIAGRVLALLESMRSGLLASCAKAPLDPAIILGLERTVQLLGGTGSSTLSDVLKCREEPSPTPLGHPGWLVEGSDNFIAGVARLCGNDPMIAGDYSEFDGIFVEEGGGMPDDWPVGKMYQTKDGINFDIAGGKYSVGFTRGTAKSGTAYEFRGTITIRVDANGRLLGGTGTGKGRIIYPSGDIKNNVPDSVTFTVTQTEQEPAWCSTEPPP